MSLNIGSGVSGTTLPHIVSGCRAYQAGNTLIGTAELTLPAIEWLTDTIKGPGIAGEVETVVQGMIKAMTASVKLHVPTAQQFAMVAAATDGLTFRAALQSDDNATGKKIIVPFTCEMKGQVKSLNPGKLVPGEKADGQNDIAVSYIRIIINNTVAVHIDQLNMVCVIDGVDYLSAVRSAL